MARIEVNGYEGSGQGHEGGRDLCFIRDDNKGTSLGELALCIDSSLFLFIVVGVARRKQRIGTMDDFKEVIHRLRQGECAWLLRGCGGGGE